MKVGILQLGDLHFENSDYLDRIDSIFSACEYDLRQSSYLFITIVGDIAKKGHVEEFIKAKQFIDTLQAKIKNKINLLQIKLVIVPGNHDCCFDKVKATRKDVIKACRVDLIEEEDYFEDATLVQNNFWSFYSSIMNEVPDDKISFKKEFTPSVSYSKIIFHCYNSSWMSEINEVYGNIVIPENKFLSNNAEAITISLFHHPINWLSPNTRNNNRARFEEHIINTSNIVLYAHEHDKGGAKNIFQKSNKVIFSEGKAFQKDNSNDSGFNYLDIDLKEKKVTCKLYKSDSCQYIADTEETYEFNQKEKREFVIKNEFQNKIESLNIPLKHSKKAKLQLGDIFIYPDLEPIKDDNIIQYPNSKEIIHKIKENTNVKIVIEGEEQSGKTSLLFSLYKKFYDIGYCPIYLRGKYINDTKVKDIVKKILKEQYYNNEFSLYIQQSKKVLLLDNLHKSPLNSKYRAKLLKNLSEHFDYIVITTNSSMIANLATDEITILKDFDKYKILPLGHEKRGELIEQWLRIGENEMTIQEEHLLKLMQTRLDEINSLIGNKLMPSFPIFILTLLQGLDAQIFPQDYSQTSYAHCYHALITAGLVKEGLKDELTSYFNLLKELSFFIFSSSSDLFSKTTFEDFFNEFKGTYFINHSSGQVLSNLSKANIIKYDDENYTFSYKYIFYYLVAQKISANIEKYKKMIEGLCDNIHIEKNANILIFLTHHSKAQLLLDNIILASELPFENSKPITLDKNDSFSSFISEFLQNVKNDIIEERDPKQEVKKDLKRKDDIERSRIEKESKEEDLTPEIVEISQAFRTIKILGQIVKNQKGDFEKDKLSELVESAYRTCFRFVGFFTKILQDDKDIIIKAISEELEEKSTCDRIEIEKTVITFLQFISYRVCIDSFTNLMFAVGSKGMDELYENVTKKIDTSAAKIVTFAIKSYYGSINTEELKQLFKEVENNHIAQSILRIYVRKHLYTNYVERSKKERIIEIAKFKPNAIIPRIIRTKNV